MHTKTSKLLDIRMNDGSRNFADLPELVFSDKLQEHTKALINAVVTEFITDWIAEVWLTFEYRGHKFSINNQMGNYWFFVENTNCPDEILLEVVEHFKTRIEK
jgi:hypothetical protein